MRTTKVAYSHRSDKERTWGLVEQNSEKGAVTPGQSCYSHTFWKDQGCLKAFQRGCLLVNSTVDVRVMWWFLTLQVYHLLMPISDMLHFLLQNLRSCHPCEWENNTILQQRCLKKFHSPVLFISNLTLTRVIFYLNAHRLHFLLYLPALNILIVVNDKNISIPTAGCTYSRDAW